MGLIHKDVLGVKKMDAGNSQTFEYLILELANRSIIAIIYCPPNSSIPVFLNEFMDWISHLLNKYIDPLILGDLNVNLAEPGVSNSAAFLECLKTYELMQSTLHTRVAACWTILSPEKPPHYSWINQRFYI